MVIHGGHTYLHQRQTGKAAMVIPIPHRRHTYHRQRKNRYGSYGPSNYLIVLIRTIVRDKPVRLRWSFQYVIVVIRTIIRDKPVRQRWSFQ